ncbi:MAG: NAD-dependent deacylase [Pseudomonadota bacterium]
MSYKSILILTGAGVSAESGLGTFRDKDGIWTKHRLEDVATPQGFARNPELVYDFYNKRRRDLQSAEPNAAHFALAKLESAIQAKGGEFVLVTQNVDDMHEKAGSQNIIHMHGELNSGLCAVCGWRGEWRVDMEAGTPCPNCAHEGLIRPDVVWFGEFPYLMDDIYERLALCDLFVSIGTSGAVYPAADFVREARLAGAHTVELNLEPSENAYVFNDAYYGPATEIVPIWAAKLAG